MSISFSPDQTLVMITAFSWAAAHETLNQECVITFNVKEDPWGTVNWMEFPNTENILVLRAFSRFERELETYRKKRGQGIAPVRKYHRLLTASLNDWMTMRNHVQANEQARVHEQIGKPIRSWDVPVYSLGDDNS